MEEIQVRVSGIDFSYGENGMSGLQIRFNSFDPAYEVNVSGRVSSTMDEYLLNMHPDKLNNLVRSKLVQRIEYKEETRADGELIDNEGVESTKQ